jgi:4-oxalocrotonate tautomerase
MPHVIVKLFSGRSEQQKAKIAEDVTRAVMIGANVPEAAVSVSIEDVAKDARVETVYKPDILGKPDSLYKKPGYDPSRRARLAGTGRPAAPSSDAV